MLLIDAPYVSDFLKQTIETLNQPVVDTPGARRMMSGSDVAFISQDELGRRLKAGERVYTNSENSLDVIIRSADDSNLARQIEVCKDKALFRENIAHLHPAYRFKRATLDELATLDISDMGCPFIAKPSRGFFSLGVHVVNDHAEWPEVVRTIQDEQAAMNDEYPEEVVDSGQFIIEEGIEGDEYAIDVYFDDNGEPVITNILYHQFASKDDVSDRLYYTSSEIMEAMLEPFTRAVQEIGKACGFRNFPIHLEVRVDEDGVIIPIEANPLRFAGWCVADITNHAWQFNHYEYYLNNKRPDWPAILKERAGKVFAMVIGDVPSDIDRQRIENVDYDALCNEFDTVLELRKIDYREYPVFAFVFAEADVENRDKLEAMLAADFSRFIS